MDNSITDLSSILAGPDVQEGTPIRVASYAEQSQPLGLVQTAQASTAPTTNGGSPYPARAAGILDAVRSSVSSVQTTVADAIKSAGQSVGNAVGGPTGGGIGSTWALPLVLAVLAAGVVYFITVGRAAGKKFSISRKRGGVSLFKK